MENQDTLIMRANFGNTPLKRLEEQLYRRETLIKQKDEQIEELERGKDSLLLTISKRSILRELQ